MFCPDLIQLKSNICHLVWNIKYDYIILEMPTYIYTLHIPSLVAVKHVAIVAGIFTFFQQTL